MSRIVEAYVGEYASGKSECAINRALTLLTDPEAPKPINLVDFDTVEPAYTLRPIRRELISLGLDVIAWDPGATMGLGETGSLITEEMVWALKRPGSIIFDIGYGVKGAQALNLIEGSWQDPDLRIIVVLNLGRPMTGSFNEMLEYVQQLGPLHGLINNSHLGDDTDVSFIQEGAEVVTKVGEILHLPVIATAADERFRDELGPVDKMGHSVRYLRRFMPRALW